MKFIKPKDIVNEFSSFFSTVYVTPSGAPAAMKFSHCTSNQFGDAIRFSEESILDALNTLSVKMTSDPDGIPSFILKDCAVAFVTPLRISLSLSLVKGVVFPNG